jgi:hypothetical protein
MGKDIPVDPDLDLNGIQAQGARALGDALKANSTLHTLSLGIQIAFELV